jgi:hypothetical protein
MKIEKAKDLAKLVKAGIVARPKRVVLVVRDGLRARLFNIEDRVSGKKDGLVEKDDVWFLVAHGKQQIAVDAMNERPNWGTDGGGPQIPRALLISGDIESDQVLAEPAKTQDSVAGTRSRPSIADVENPAFPWRGQ